MPSDPTFVQRYYREHDVSTLGEHRRCPITGKRFGHAWSKFRDYDSCDQCQPAGPQLARNIEQGRRRKRTLKRAKATGGSTGC